MANHLTQQNTQNIALIIENNDYSVNYANVIRDNFDGNIVLDIKINSDEKDLTIVAKQVAEIESDVDHIIVLAVNESLNKGIFTALDNEGILTTVSPKIIGGDPLLPHTIIDTFGEKLNGAQTVLISDQIETQQTDIKDQLLADYEIQSTESFTIISADSAQLVIDAINTVGYDSESIKTYLNTFTQETPRNGLVGDF